MHNISGVRLRLFVRILLKLEGSSKAKMQQLLVYVLLIHPPTTLHMASGTHVELGIPLSVKAARIEKI